MVTEDGVEFFFGTKIIAPGGEGTIGVRPVQSVLQRFSAVEDFGLRIDSEAATQLEVRAGRFGMPGRS